MKRLWTLSLIAVVGASAVAAPPTGRYKTIVDKMNKLASDHSAVSRMFSLGTNDDGVEIVAMRVSLTPEAADPAKVAHIVVGTHHGNELAAPEFVVHFTTELLKKYVTSEVFRDGLSDREWVIVPVLNVSGYNAANRHEKGHDPNRDYPGPCTSSPGGKLKSVRLLMEHLKTRNYVGSLTVHGYVSAFTYPWGVNTSNTHTLDHNAFDRATREAASINGYRHGTSTDIVYPCDGAYEDYAYWKHGAWSLLLELRDGSANDIRKTTEASFVYFDRLDSSPSVQHHLTHGCSRAGHLDLRNE